MREQLPGAQSGRTGRFGRHDRAPDGERRSIRVRWAGALVLLLLCGAGTASAQQLVYSDGFEAGSSWEWTTTLQTLLVATPYRNLADIDHVSGVFCMAAPCPWDPPDRLHDGIDFHPVADLVPFQAGCAGVVAVVDAFLNPANGYYQVNVILRCANDPRYGLVYAFEPISAQVADRDLQLANIFVQVGSPVAAGDLVGNLLRVDLAAAHVHFGFLDRWEQVCPDPFISDPVRTEILDLIHQDHPTWGICN